MHRCRRSLPTDLDPTRQRVLVRPGLHQQSSREPLRLRHRTHRREPGQEPGLLREQIAASVRQLAQLGHRVIDRAARLGQPLRQPGEFRAQDPIRVRATTAYGLIPHYRTHVRMIGRSSIGSPWKNLTAPEAALVDAALAQRGHQMFSFAPVIERGTSAGGISRARSPPISGRSCDRVAASRGDVVLYVAPARP